MANQKRQINVEKSGATPLSPTFWAIQATMLVHYWSTFLAVGFCGDRSALVLDGS